ncbi:excalibur calcium-binding domain-containing protein (plasmid) [Streptomyces sp. NBC_01544]|uniref:excalibur calcium-binding domain-containing protein n=1 Tax=Streptomyces sp. NBC_01544 TaxID=2975871 RepID=UPI002F9127C5
MAKNSGDGCVEYGLGCFVLVFVGAVVFVGCKMDDASESMSWDKPATTQSAKPDWRLDEDDESGGDSLLWIDMYKSEELDLLDWVSAQDVNSETYSTDDLNDNEGLTAADVEVKLLSKPKHGTAKLNKDDGTVTYTPRAEFRGDDEIRYLLKLKGKPEVVEGSYTITVDLSPGGQARAQSDQFENCAEARAAGAAPVREGEPGYGPHLDRDGDGVGCDWG